MNTYYTKCGREFKKSTKAETTGYMVSCSKELPDTKCGRCLFVIRVKNEWPEMLGRWECRAGSQKPNHKNEWSGSLDDKANIHIKSLNMDFIEKVTAYLEVNKGSGITGYSFNQDLSNCRRLISISVEQNKKGIAAKKKLVEEFFTERSEKEK